MSESASWKPYEHHTSKKTLKRISPNFGCRCIWVHALIRFWSEKVKDQGHSSGDMTVDMQQSAARWVPSSLFKFWCTLHYERSLLNMCPFICLLLAYRIKIQLIEHGSICSGDTLIQQFNPSRLLFSEKMAPILWCKYYQNLFGQFRQQQHLGRVPAPPCQRIKHWFTAVITWKRLRDVRFKRTFHMFHMVLWDNFYSATHDGVFLWQG